MAPDRPSTAAAEPLELFRSSEWSRERAGSAFPLENGAMIVDCALYTAGRRQSVANAAQAVQRARCHPDSFVWIGLYEPTYDEFDDVALHFGPHPLAIEDAVEAHQRPKLEIYDECTFVVLKTLGYERGGRIEVGEVMLFTGDCFVVSVRHGQLSPLAPVRRRLEGQPEILGCGPSAVLYAVCDAVVDGYERVVADLEDDVLDLEASVFSSGLGDDAEKIYALKREVLALRHAVNPLRHPMHTLASGRIPIVAPAVQPFFRDVADHVARVVDRADAFDALLTDIFEANLSRIKGRQNEDMRRISAWVAILAVNTVIAAVFGMNFDNMPELRTRYGYFIVLGVSLAVCVLLYRRFRRTGWL